MLSDGRGFIMLNRSTTKTDVAVPIMVDVGADEAPLDVLSKHFSKIYTNPGYGKDEEIKWYLAFVDKTFAVETYFYYYESKFLGPGHIKETGRVHNWYLADALPFDADPLLHFGVALAKRGGSYVLTEVAT